MTKLAIVTGDYVKILRITSGLSKTQLAKKIGVSYYYLNKIEKGEVQRWKPKVVPRLARAFRMKTATFVRDIGSMYLARYSDKGLVRQEKLLLIAFGKIYKNLRERRGLSVEQVARKSRVPVANIRTIERGAGQYNQTIWRAICLAIGYQPWDVLKLVYKELRISLHEKPRVVRSKRSTNQRES